MQFNNVFQSWLTANKISEDTQKEFGVTFTDEAIVFPVHDIDGTFIFNKYRRSPLVDTGVKYWYDKGGKVTLYGYNKAKYFNTILIVEGEKDALVSWSHNIPAVTSTGGALSFQKEWADILKDKEVIICFDNDKAGGEGMVKVLDLISHAKVIFIPDLPNVKDISDYVMYGGDLHALLKTAKHFDSIEEVEEDRIQRRATFRSVHFHDAYIKAHTKVNTYVGPRKTYSSDKVTNAKSYPIDQLLDFRNGKTKCLFHNEKTPSLQYYPNTNTCYCFGGCGKTYDAINIYMAKYGCSFKEAVIKLNEML